METKSDGVSNVLIEVIKDGRVIATRSAHNLMVNVGKADTAKRLVVAPTKFFKYMRLGKGGTAETSAQSGVLTFVPSSNRTCNTAAMSGTRTAKFTRTWITTDFSATGIREAGIFSQLTNGVGTMLARVTFAPVDKPNTVSLKIIWTVKYN